MNQLEGGQIGVEVGDGFDAAEIILKGDVLVRGVSIFVGEAEAEQNTGNLEGVMHLRDERNRAAFANENGFFAEAFFQGGLGFQENRGMIRSNTEFSGAQDFKFAMNGFRQQLSNVLLDKPGDFVRILMGNEPSGE